MKNFISLAIIFSSLVFEFDQEAKYLVLNYFDKPLKDIGQVLTGDFKNSTFNFDHSIEQIFEDIDSHKNHASKYMEEIKDLWVDHNVNYML